MVLSGSWIAPICPNGLVGILRDRVLWLLSNRGGKTERSRLRRYMGVRYAYLNPILEELAREGRIRIEGETITLVGR
jgi:hypothetical protein